jgi:integrase
MMGLKVREKKKSSGEWWVFLNHKGKRKSKLIGDRQTAETVAKELRKRISEGDFNLTKKEIPTFRQYAERWLKRYAISRCKYSTIVSYKSNLKNHILPVFGEKKLDTITRPEVKEFVFRKAKETSPKTVRNLINLMSDIFTHALEDDIIKVNPASRMGKMLPKNDTKAKINPLTREEVKVFLETISKTYQDYYVLFSRYYERALN